MKNPVTNTDKIAKKFFPFLGLLLAILAFTITVAYIFKVEIPENTEKINHDGHRIIQLLNQSSLQISKKDIESDKGFNALKQLEAKGLRTKEIKIIFEKLIVKIDRLQSKIEDYETKLKKQETDWLNEKQDLLDKMDKLRSKNNQLNDKLGQ